ncbi:hypothetical protein GEMRC1_003150 [Eukaryota sp. GEM-RC1]
MSEQISVSKTILGLGGTITEQKTAIDNLVNAFADFRVPPLRIVLLNNNPSLSFAAPELLETFYQASPNLSELWHVLEHADYKETLFRRGLVAATSVIHMSSKLTCFPDVHKKALSLLPKMLSALNESHVPLVSSVAKFLTALAIYSTTPQVLMITKVVTTSTASLSKLYQTTSRPSKQQHQSKKKQDQHMTTIINELILALLFLNVCSVPHQVE